MKHLPVDFIKNILYEFVCVQRSIVTVLAEVRVIKTYLANDGMDIIVVNNDHETGQ